MLPRKINIKGQNDVMIKTINGSETQEMRMPQKITERENLTVAITLNADIQQLSNTKL